MALQFERSEHEARIAAARRRLRGRGVDALLVFAQGSALAPFIYTIF